MATIQISLFDLCWDARPARSETRLGSPYPLPKDEARAPASRPKLWSGELYLYPVTDVLLIRFHSRTPDLIQASGITRYCGGRPEQSLASRSSLACRATLFSDAASGSDRGGVVAL
jgi:hypothetical protein